VVLATERFSALAVHAAQGFGLPGARIAVVPHPLGGTDPARVREWADAAVEPVLALLTGTA
jgi:hypothetical protein